MMLFLYVKKIKNNIVLKDRSLDLSNNKEIPSWVKVDYIKMEGVFLYIPERNDIYTDIDEHRIVELYSK